jgi:recombination protein RecR
LLSVFSTDGCGPMSHLLGLEKGCKSALCGREKAGHFRGLYHVLHGLLSPLDAIGPDDIRFSELLKRVEKEKIAEVILALNPTVEGESTAGYIRDRLKGSGIVVSRIAYGIPVGGSLEYADPLTLSRALDNRKEL